MLGICVILGKAQAQLLLLYRIFSMVQVVFHCDGCKFIRGDEPPLIERCVCTIDCEYLIFSFWKILLYLIFMADVENFQHEDLSYESFIIRKFFKSPVYNLLH